jgi:hypothetical protein
MQRIVNEIRHDPLELGYEGKTRQEQADIFNTVRGTRTRELSAKEVLYWLGQGGLYHKLITALPDKTPVQQSAIEVFLMLLRNGESFEDPNNNPIITIALRESGIFTIAEIVALVINAQVEFTRANELGLPHITAEMIERAFLDQSRRERKDPPVIEPPIVLPPLEPEEPDNGDR